MENKKNQSPVKNVKRVKMLKRLIIWVPIVMSLISFALCVVLLITTQAKNEKINEYETEKNILKNQLMELQIKLDELSEEQSENESKDSPLETDKVETEEQNSKEVPENEETLDNEQKEYAHHVYLTFDDGPSSITEKILDILEQYQVKATFFVQGKDTQVDKDRIKKIADAGHTIGMHSFSHRYSEIYRSKDAFASDFQKIKALVEEVTGVPCNLYRFPGGSSNTISPVDMKQYIQYLNEQGVTYFDWNSSSEDSVGKLKDTQKFIDNCMFEFEYHENVVVLMHDIYDNDVMLRALPEFIELLLSRGDCELLPITDETPLIQHLKYNQ